MNHSPINTLDLPKTVGLIYSEVKRDYFPTESQYITEKDALRDAQAIATYIEKMGIKTYLYPGTPKLVTQLLKDNPDMVFNLVGSIRGQEYLSATIPGILESLDVPYTGAGILGESLAYNKFVVKKLLNQQGIPVPAYQLFNSASDAIDPSLRFPLISKLNEIHGAVELTKDAVSETEKHLRSRIKQLIDTYDQAVLVEEFIVGQEVTAYMLVGLNKKVYLGEKIFKNQDDKFIFADFETQWLDHSPDTITYQKFIDPVLTEHVKKAFDVLKMDDYGKFDVRIDAAGRYHFIDSNSNPFFGPKEIESPMANVLDLYGITFNGILRRLMLNTLYYQQGRPLIPPTAD